MQARDDNIRREMHKEILDNGKEILDKIGKIQQPGRDLSRSVSDARTLAILKKQQPATGQFNWVDAAVSALPERTDYKFAVIYQAE